MDIFKNKFIEAKFYMRDEKTEFIDSIPNVRPSQIHGKNIIYVNDENILDYSLPKRPEADGILLTAKNSQASLRFADCTPVLVWNEADKNFVMLLHSGYKGTVLNISGEGIKLISNIFGHECLKDLRAWIGPCISREFYCRDVDNDEWTLRGLNTFHHENYDDKSNDEGKIYFDMAGEIEFQLIESGLKKENIKLSGINTFTDLRCYSYRRGDIKERMTLYAACRYGLY